MIVSIQYVLLPPDWQILGFVNPREGRLDRLHRIFTLIIAVPWETPGLSFRKWQHWMGFHPINW